MGLPGSGKTTLASKLVPLLNAKRLNNDEVRKVLMTGIFLKKQEQDKQNVWLILLKNTKKKAIM